MEAGAIGILGGVVIGWALEQLKADILARRAERQRMRQLNLLLGRRSRTLADEARELWRKLWP